MTGRGQILALPAVQAAHADVAFAISTYGQGFAASPPCGPDCRNAGNPAMFAARVATIGARLERSARAVSPELPGRIGRFRIEVNDALGIGTGSSAGGRVALGSGLAGLEPTDTVIAFLIAREMAHVIGRHAEENSGASIVFSALSALLPGINVIVRLAASAAGSDALKRSWATQQQREADVIALLLLEHSGLSSSSVALDLATGIRGAGVPADEWGARYFESIRRVTVIAAPPPPLLPEQPVVSYSASAAE